MFPADDQQQQLINALDPGYFVVEVKCTEKQVARVLGNWMLSMSNSNNPDFASKVQMNLFAPSFLYVEAGIPFTFSTEISGRTSSEPVEEKSLTIVSAKKTDRPEINSNMQSTELISEYLNRVNYVSFYESRVGTYEINLKASHVRLGDQSKIVKVTVLPSKFELLNVVQHDDLTARTAGAASPSPTAAATIGESLSMVFTLQDRFGNNILESKSESYRRDVERAFSNY